jgi:iron-sulfur cluster repair protein YtfE (RIC family)
LTRIFGEDPQVNAISIFLGQDHKRCDELFVEAERLAARGDFAAAGTACRQFIDAMEHHFGMEEHVLFPAFEQATGSAMGPTAVMRHEHGQMRNLFEEMASSLAGQHGDDFLGASETLLVLMQQHNAKEEQILYPASDRVLSAPELLEAMRARSA